MTSRAKCRVGFDLRWAPTTLSHYIRGLLAALVSGGADEFEFVCYGNADEIDRIRGVAGSVEFRKVPWSRYGIRGQLFFPKRLRSDGIQLFHSPFYLIPFLTRVATIATIHDINPVPRVFDEGGNWAAGCLRPERYGRPCRLSGDNRIGPFQARHRAPTES
jgi:hypothetical protein